MRMRHFLAAVLAALGCAAGVAARQAPATPPAPAGEWTARIKIDIDRTIGEIHPHLFGGFAEHLGRMIYGGIYDEGNPLSDADGFRRDVMEAIRGLQTGGLVTRPTLALLAERGPEAVVPLDRGSVIDYRKLADAVAQAVSRRPQVLQAEEIALLQHHQPLDQVAQLADVAVPRVVDQGL